MNPTPPTFPDKILVYVSPADIKHGIPRDCGACPITRAAQPLFPGYTVRTGACIYVRTEYNVCQQVGKILALYNMPQVAHDLIHHIDQGTDKALPTTFTATLVK